MRRGDQGGMVKAQGIATGAAASSNGASCESNAVQRRLDAALESMSDAFALFDADDHMVLHNGRFLEFFPFLTSLGDLRGQTFRTLVSVPNGEWSRVDDPERYVEERMARHDAADGRPFSIRLENGGWVRVRERRTPDGGIVSTWTDISELKATEQHLLDTIDSIGEGFVLLDDDGHLRLCNQRFRDMLGDGSAVFVAGTSFDNVLRQAALAGRFMEAGTDPEGFATRMMQQLGGDGETRLEVPLRNGGWVLASHRRMKDGSVVGIWTDVTIQKKREAELVAIRAQLERHTDALSEFARLVARQARSDALTGLPNRFALEERLDQLLHDGPNGVCVLYVDVDRFKLVNDTVGHAAGDEVLRGVAQTLKRQLRGDDLLARIGGDEFAVVLAEVEEEEAMRVAERLSAAVRGRSFVAEGRSFSLGLSIGLARASANLSSVARLLAAADTACYIAKDAGPGRIQLYDLGDISVSHAQETLSWAERIQLALDADMFVLHLQAIVSDTTGIAGYEALIRLMDERGRPRTPASFLPAARRLGYMSRIDEWVCRRTIEYAARLANAGSNRYVSMNFGVRTLTDPTFQRRFLELLDRSPEASRTLAVEITETDEIEDIETLSNFIDTLRERGLRLFLDDFGSGYNSFDVLKRLHVDGIKIDWAVTHDLLDDPIDEALVKAAVSIADSLGLELVAEGVERDAELDRLRTLGVRLFQGHYFHKPEDAEAALLR
ncbi:MAG: diguanylate cyclase/phosphodiesterase [Xanthobacteraceae bacterium]|nr:diguanylate cyclase/phosphodiesterase [Xanthobacteraceae bacterium]